MDLIKNISKMNLNVLLEFYWRFKTAKYRILILKLKF